MNIAVGDLLRFWRRDTIFIESAYLIYYVGGHFMLRSKEGIKTDLTQSQEDRIKTIMISMDCPKDFEERRWCQISKSLSEHRYG